MFIQTEATPNPATLKFIPGRTVLDTGTMEFSSRESAARSPLAERLFGVPGVTGVFYGYDFVTVTKADGEWQQLKPAILGAIMEHYMSGAPLLADGSAHNDEAADEEDEFFNESDADTVAQIKDLIETRVRPAVANDGGDITFRGFKDGMVYLNMKGSCAGCPSSTATLQHGIQNLLQAFRARRGRSPADVTSRRRAQSEACQRHDSANMARICSYGWALRHSRIRPLDDSSLLYIAHADPRHRYGPRRLRRSGARHRHQQDDRAGIAGDEARPCRSADAADRARDEGGRHRLRRARPHRRHHRPRQFHRIARRPFRRARHCAGRRQARGRRDHAGGLCRARRQRKRRASDHLRDRRAA